MIRDYQASGRTWFIRGKQRLILTYGQYKRLKLIGTLEYETGKIVMTFDNARIHHAKLTQPFLEENRNRLELVFLPPYNPELNLMEGVWEWLKESIIQHVFFGNAQKIILAVQAFSQNVDHRRAETTDRLCVRM